jgi:hypothetical protein
MTETLTMVPVESSNIAAVGHDVRTNELHVHFKNGSKSVWSDVHRIFFQNMLTAESKGKYLNQRIKGSFPHRKL